MGDRRVLLDAVPEIEDVRATGEGVKDALHRNLELPASRDQRQGVEIALQRQAFRQLFRCPDRVYRLVQPDRVNARLARVSRKLASRALGETDDRHAGKTGFELADQPSGRRDYPLLKLQRRQASGPAVEQLQGL